MKPRAVLAVALMFFLAGCDDSKNPLSNPKTAKPDDRLIGLWRGQGDKNGATYYHVGRAGEPFPASMLRIVEVTTDQGKVEPPEEYLAFPAVVEGKSYLNVVVDAKQVKLLDQKGWNPDLVEAYTLLKYEVNGDRCVVWLIDSDAEERAIRSGKIKGEFKQNLPMFTDTSENVARFVAEAGDGLFNLAEPARFERLKIAERSSRCATPTGTPRP